jgi:hypothetical protein
MVLVAKWREEPLAHLVALQLYHLIGKANGCYNDDDVIVIANTLS